MKFTWLTYHCLGPFRAGPPVPVRPFCRTWPPDPRYNAFRGRCPVQVNFINGRGEPEMIGRMQRGMSRHIRRVPFFVQKRGRNSAEL